MRWKEEKRGIEIWAIVATLTFLLSTPCIAGDTVISRIEPNEGSIGGETRILIFGSGFSEDTYNEGNAVQLVSTGSGARAYDCAVLKDGTTESIITCYTPPNMVEDYYWVRVKVNGVDVPENSHCGSATNNKCRFRVHSGRTPTITSVEPTAGLPGTIVKINGRIFTNRYGSNVDVSDNGRTERILRVYAVGKECLLKYENDNLYGIELSLNSNDQGDWGYMKCKLNGNFIGNSNMSYIIEGGFGRSYRDMETLHVYSNDQIANFQTFAEITSVTPATGSLEGGTMVTITGNYFDETRTKPVVKVGGTECEVQDPISSTQIICKTQKKPSMMMNYHPGNRGMTMECWNETSKNNINLPDIDNLDNTASDYSVSHIDVAYFDESADAGCDNCVSRLRGYFVPPKTGDYSFHILADDGAHLLLSNTSDPSFKETIAIAPYYTNRYDRTPEQSSSRMSLTAGDHYYMEVWHREYSNGANVKVKAQLYNTSLTNHSSGMVHQEHQLIKITSNVVREIQNITLQGFTSPGGAVDEQQQVTVTENTGALSSATFRLCLYSVCTKKLTTSSSGTDIATALKELPLLHAEESASVTVAPITSGSGVILTVTFHSKRGNFAQMTYKKYPGAGGETIGVSITETRDGAPSGENVVLRMDNKPSPVIPVDATAQQVQEALTALFGARCPSVLTSMGKVHHTYETSLPPSTGGTHTTEMEAFCGKGMVKNPWYLYKEDAGGLSLGQNLNTICFAYHGLMQNLIGIWYSYRDAQGEFVEWQGKHFVLELNQDSGQTSFVWEYACFNMLTALEGHRPGGTDFRVKRVQVYKEGEGDYYIDEVDLGRSQTVDDPRDVRDLIMPAAKLNNNLIDSVTVNKYTKDGNPVFEVEFTPLDCGCNFPKFSTFPGQVKTGASIDVQRPLRASCAISGSFTVSYAGQSKSGIAVQSTAEEFKNHLSSIPEMGDLYVYKHGVCDGEITFSVAFLSNTGDQEDIQVTSQLLGTDVTIATETKVDGHVRFDPIQGDMLRTSHDLPQVNAMINEVPVMCSGNCSFHWTTAATPTITSISPVSGVPSNTEVTISGTGFDTTHTNNVVKIGGATCATKSSTATQIVCDVGDGPRGEHPVEIIVPGKGNAQNSGNAITFTYEFQISSASPLTCTVGGGCPITLVGYGFSDTDSVMIGLDVCEVTAFTSTQITCSAPPNSATGSETLMIVHSDNTNSTDTFTFTYNAATMVISSVSPAVAPVSGGETLTLTGTGLDTATSLSICGQAVTMATQTASQVEAELPPHAPGVCVISLMSSSGQAVDSSDEVPTIEYTLKLKNVFPQEGSLYGGTQLTLTGEGFPTNKSSTMVKVGSHDCVIDTASANEIICNIADTGMVHKIDNTGVHYEFMEGYAWNPDYLKVKVGDVLEWSWSFPDWVTGMKPKVEQVNCQDMSTPISGGFSSGDGVARGKFVQRMTQLGDICVSSGYIDLYRTTMFTMRIKVEPRVSYVTDVMVTVGDYEAVYDVASGVSNPADTSSCTGFTGTVPGCTDAAPSGGDPTKFNFKFWSCSSPVVTSVSPNSGTTDTTISITGSGFHSTKCRNQIKFGKGSCEVVTSSDTSVQCKISTLNSPEIGVLSMIEFRTHNLGHALIDISNPLQRAFALEPLVSGVSPDTGSTAGGTMVTLSGSGFQGDMPDIQVTVGGFSAEVKQVSYEEIVIKTPAAGSGNQAIQVKVKSSLGTMVTASCATTCQFNFDPSITPEMTAVLPTSLTGEATNLTITGSNFGVSTQPSQVMVTVGTENCIVIGVTDTSIDCSITNVAVGSNAIMADIEGLGTVSGSLSVQGDKVINNVSPVQGSTNGGTEVVISGNGFLFGSTTVSIDGTDCPVTEVTLGMVKCTTPAHAEGAVKIVVTSGGQTYTEQDYSYAAVATPSVTTVSPAQGSAGTTVTITGSNFASQNADNTVKIGGVACTVQSSTTTQIQCTAGANSVGSHNVVVMVNGLGLSNDDQAFEYQLAVSNINPTSGSSAGGQRVTVTGSGLDGSTAVTVCSEDCVLDNAVARSPSEYVCFTPAATSAVTTTSSCDVVVTRDGVNKTLTGAYTYSAALTPTITAVSPPRGSTAGGTGLTITGTGFGTVKADLAISVAGIPCTIGTVSDTEVTCTTGAAGQTIRSKVRLERNGNGIADQTNADFHYVDVWSSLSTWGGVSLPVEGDLVVIQENQTVLLDTSPPKLKMVLVNGGELIFDDKDLTLKADNILVVKGGLFQIGTEEKPFEYQATVELYGHHRTKELPIYGTKNLGIREGRLELHGQFVPITWTKLASTTAAGSNTIVVQDEVTWKAGDELVIATTSHRHSQIENEKCTIQSIAADKKTITCAAALTYEHLGVSEAFDGTTLDFRAEVGLLTHNVKVVGNSDPQWQDTIEACPDGFDTGEFATQTCFQGRFGEEIGSDQFGAHILIHAPRPNENLVSAHIEFVEVRHAGQAFRLGRYPIHFHLNGDMTGSYVRGCGIHDTFNRAVNIHGTHNVLVERNVGFDIMGGAFFLEDGIETGNIFQYNLLVFVRMSSSLLNDDVTPAAFWATNPNNTFEHNAVAGGTHFGFWYRMHEHPDGPSATTDVCGRRVELGKFFNNTVHSQGWFGLWIFETYTPKLGSSCSSNDPTPAIFRNIFVWNCEKGVEFVNSGPLQLHDSYLVNNKLAGFEVKKYIDGEQHTDNSLMLYNTMIVGHATSLTREEQGCTARAVVLGYGTGQVTKKVTFVNFDEPNCAVFGWARITGTCSVFCGGFTSSAEQLKFVNAGNKGHYDWTFEGQIKDVDGTLHGTEATKATYAGKTVITCSDTLPPSCTPFPDFASGKPACSCPSQYKFHRFAFNNIQPESLLYKEIIVTNQYGNETLPYKKKDTTHPKGWHAVLVDGEETLIEFKDAEQITNISYSGRHYEYNSGDYTIVRQNIGSKPDRFIIDGSTHINESDTALDPASNCTTGQWVYDGSKSQIAFTVCGGDGSSRRKRSTTVPTSGSNDRVVQFKAYKCFYKGCTPPPDPNTVPPIDERPDPYQLWTDTSLWVQDGDVVKNSGGGSYGLPQDGDSVTILADTWVVVAATTLPYMETLTLYGGLELDNDGTTDYVLNCTYIIILGGRLVVGWPNVPFLSNVNIILRGSHDTPAYPLQDGPAVGSKAIGVFGGLDLHGKEVGVYWTTLATTANAGDNQVTLTEAVNWEVGSEIVIAPTSYKISETEIFKILAVSIDKTVLTLDGNLQYRHIGVSEQAGNWTLEMRAEVGLLTRNIKVIGQEYDQMTEQAFGARIIVGRSTDGPNLYIGYARVSNVEFYRTAQEGWVESYDPRYSIAFVDSGPVSNIKPSYVHKNAFHHGFGPAVGVYGANDMPVEDNVAHGTVWYCMESNSHGSLFRRNLCVHVEWEGAYLQRAEPLNIRFNGAFNLIKAKDPVLEGNHAAGYERVGFHVPPESCDSVSANPYSDNVAHSGLIGLALFPITSNFDVPCMRFSNFSLWRNAYFGAYVNQNPSSLFTDLMSADNGVGVFTMVNTPPALTHMYEHKTSEIRNSVLIGRSSTFDCATDKVDSSDVNIVLSAQAKSCKPSRFTGVVMTSFMSGHNKAPEKPLCNIMAYQAIAGQSKLQGVTFAKFNDRCGAGTDVALTPNNANDDGIHPLHVTDISFVDVPTDNMYKNAWANLGKINSADCVDMPCDGLQKVLVEDTDGTFLGTPGAIISKSEYEYNGDQRYGKGDYRIPKEMLTEPDGTRIPYRTLAPNLGIIRNAGAIYRDKWQAYEVHGMTYRMLIVESLDADTETRRLSPIAFLGDGYLDLINGPQDHGWCSGYTCRKRLSTFPILAATGKNYLMHYTSTSPQDTRFLLLNSNDNDAIVLSIWYALPNALDVYHNDHLVMPKNGRLEGPANDKQLILDPPPQNDPDFYLPDVASDSFGANYYNRRTGILTILIKGPMPVVIKQRKTVIVSHQFPPMSIDEFFDREIVRNLAAFLNIPASKVRITDVIPDNASAGRRRKRATGSDMIVGAIIEIGDLPQDGVNDTASDSMSQSDLDNAENKITNEIQLGGNFSEIINSTDGTFSVASSPPDTSDPDWTTVSQNESPYTVLVEAHALQFNPAPVPLHEGTEFTTQPKVMVVDKNGNRIKNGSPWTLTATLRVGTGSPYAQLIGNTTVTMVNGWANFSGLYITHQGPGYVIDFQITDPPEGENFTLETQPFTIPSRPIKVDVVSSNNSEYYSGENMALDLELKDGVTGQRIEDIAWRNHTWSVTASLGRPELYSNTSIQGNLQLTFDVSTGRAAYSDIRLSHPGMYVLRFDVTTGGASPEYTLVYEKLVTIKAPRHRGVSYPERTNLEMKFNADYNNVVGSGKDYFCAYFGTRMAQTYPDVVITDCNTRSGSILVSITVDGSTGDVNTTIYSLCDTIEGQQTTFTYGVHTLQLSGYLSVDGQTFYGVSCGPKPTVGTADEKKFPLAVIIAVAVVSGVILVAILAFIVWKCKVHPNTKTYDVNSAYASRSDINDFIFREKSFMSIKSNNNPTAPAATDMKNGRKMYP